MDTDNKYIYTEKHAFTVIGCKYVYMQVASNIPLQASVPSTQLWSTFLLSAPPQFLYQAPPGAQQLALPDFTNVPHFGHILVLAIVGEMTAVLAIMWAISSRSGSGWRAASVVADTWVGVHTFRDIDPDDPSNVSSFVAFELTQAGVHSFCENAVAL